MSDRPLRDAGWRSQSLSVHNRMTGPETAARAEGMMPSYARAAASISMHAGYIAGMAKKRWRDADPARMSIDEVRRIRESVSAAFDDLETALLAEPADALDDRSAAEAGYRAHGLVGLVALGLMEEAAEFAAPIISVATGAASSTEVRRELEDESADLRVYLHIAGESMRIDPTSSTEAKWAEFRSRRPEMFSGPRTATVGKVDMKAAIAGLIAQKNPNGRKKP